MPVRVGLQYIKVWNSRLEKQVQKYYGNEDLPKGQIVFYGPSNFTRWRRENWDNTPLREVLLGASGAQCCVNRGFGSSCSEHHLYYYSRLVRPLEPSVLVYSPGYGNGKAFGYTPEEEFELAQRVMIYAKTDFPDLRIYLLGLSKSYVDTPDGAKLNNLFRGFAETMPDCTFLNVADYAPLNEPGLREPDGHFNHEGYRVYGEYFKEVLKDELAKF